MLYLFARHKPVISRTASFLSRKEAVLTDRLAANAIPGPASYDSRVFSRTFDRWLAGRKKRDVEDAVPYEAQTDFSAVGAGVPDSPMPVCRPSSGASSSQAPYRLASSQARKLTHSAARPLKIKAAALILKRKTEGVDA